MAGKSAILSLRIIGDEKPAVQAFDRAESRAKGFADGLDRMVGPAALAGAASGAALTAGFLGAVDAQGQANKLGDRLGLDPAEAERLGGVAGDLYADAYGTSLEQVNTAIQGVVGNIDGLATASDAELERITQKTLNLANTFDQDLGATTTAVGQLIRTGMAADADEALDIITRGLQSSDRAGADLLDTFTEYPALFERLGLDGQTATGLIAQGMEAGARSTDLVADALKEFQIRSTDASQASADAYAALGLDAEAMTAQMARGGEDAAAGLDVVLDRLRGMTDPVAQNAAAVGLFGTQAEDLGGALYALDPSSAVSALGEVAGAADSLGATDAENALTSLQRAAEQSFQAIGANAIPVIVPILENLTQWAPVLGPLAVVLGIVSGAVLAISGAMKVYAAAQAIQTAAQWASNAAWLANPITWIVLAIVAALAAVIAIVVLVVQNWDKIKAGAEVAFRTVINWIQQLIQWLGLDRYFQALVLGFNIIKDAGAKAWDSIVSGIKGVIKWVQDAIGWLGDLFGQQNKASKNQSSARTSSSARMMAAVEQPSAQMRTFARSPQVATAEAAEPQMSLARTASPMFASTSLADLSSAVSGRGALTAQPKVEVNIRVEGAIDPEGTAKTIRKVMDEHFRGNGQLRTTQQWGLGS